MKRLGPERRNTILRLFAQGWSYYAISRETGHGTGTIRRLCLAAGYTSHPTSYRPNRWKPVEPSRMGRPRAYTDEQILDALCQFYATHGRIPFSRERRGMNHGVPSDSLLKLRFGTVTNALRKAGLPVRSKGGLVIHGNRCETVRPIDPVKAEAVTRAKRAYWQQVERGKHGLVNWQHPYARRSA